MRSNEDLRYIEQAIGLARRGMSDNEGGPFGTVIVKEGKVIATGNNKVLSTNDPTAHAEIVAIRQASQFLNSFQLTGCTIYTSCEPCPMCLGAIYWARPDRIVYACTRQDAAAIGFDDDFIYKEMVSPISHRKIPMHQWGRENGLEVFRDWQEKQDKTPY
ncbi:nucleoside deaminase [Chryseolinea sp. H1M3-3]|uniref:nucleoside deaminase n=1 Tax=Chryseolinea sp. H1M3-3 TaxID=3034144 RepID=UPI0023EAAE98|nr:nucleoside deaminase [Chryseolinea sp. H1M3-3]